MSTTPTEIPSIMNREAVSDYTKSAVIVAGTLCFATAVFNMPALAFSWGYLLILVFSVLIGPRMSLRLPRSNFAISFSDSIVFLTFLIYGGELAILVSFVETFATSLYLQKKGEVWGRWAVPFNSSLAAVLTTVSYGVLILIRSLSDGPADLANTRVLVTVLGVLALLQLAGASIFAAAYQKIATGAEIWRTLKEQCLSTSFSHFTGAALAAVAFKLINYADFAITFVAVLILSVAYVNYRKMIHDIEESIVQAETAEREKAETERERRKEAEKHATQLQVSLEKEEQANIALRKSEKDFQHAALHDSLTGLANRKKFGDTLRRLIELGKEDASLSYQVLFLDIRAFKNINDSLGHTIGDKVLVIAAKRFLKTLNPTDTVARIGGDEFAIILRDLQTPEKAQKVARRVHNSLTQPISLSGHKITIDLNIGIAPSDPEYDTPEEILRDADIAMHFAKEKNDGPALFTTDMRSKFLERIQLEMDLRHAIERNELAMHYQPIISLDEERLIGFEALLRWHHSKLGMVPPFRFIPIAEDSGLILPITVWILHETCRQLAEWQRIGPEYRDLIVSVNISGKHLAKDVLIDDVAGALQKSRVAARTLKLEITESTAMENAEHSIKVLNKLKEIGVQLSIDDFGTGYSSLSHLHRLPFDTLKIDRSFVNRVGEQGEDSEVLQTVISLAKNLKMRVIAEGIETEAQLAVLQNLGCDYGQGYLLAKPKGREETEELLYRRPQWLPDGVALEPIEPPIEESTSRDHVTVH